ncbi:MAG TPA: hypothetical protein VK014_02600 [Cyclobacteriaceae bacterium]|nr:hypothetical protein [Cyclobacteriaceae bacterium]
MKKEIAILLLFCFSFYHFGYYFFYFSYRYKIESEWKSTTVHTFDTEFDKENLIKIPLHIPYMVEQEDFHTTNTSFVQDGTSYRIVKQRYVQDTLQIVYVPDVALTKLDQTIKGWITALTEGIDQEAANGKIIPKNFIKDYLQPISFLISKPYAITVRTDGGFFSCFYRNTKMDLPDPPPKTVFA